MCACSTAADLEIAPLIHLVLGLFPLNVIAFRQFFHRPHWIKTFWSYYPFFSKSFHFSTFWLVSAHFWFTFSECVCFSRCPFLQEYQRNQRSMVLLSQPWKETRSPWPVWLQAVSQPQTSGGSGTRRRLKVEKRGWVQFVFNHDQSRY